MRQRIITADQAVAREEVRTIAAIAARAVKMAAKYGLDYPFMDADMDITFAHKQCPLKLEQLLAADDANFAHDVFGIRKHMNRETCKLEGCFLPRYAQPRRRCPVCEDSSCEVNGPDCGGPGDA